MYVYIYIYITSEFFYSNFNRIKEIPFTALSLPNTTILQISPSFYRQGNFKIRNFES